LLVANGAQVSARNQGSGNAGTLNIKARSLLLDNQGSLTAATQAGEGGNIHLKVEDSLEMRRNSQISAEAGGTGNGGNITINANALVLLESSDIIANAIRGRGGNIEIDTQGLFRCEDCQISASSNLGLDGVVEISTLDPDTSLEVLDVPEQLAKPEDVVALACSATQGQAKNEFTITGRGGLPPRPSEALSSEALVSFESPEPSAGSPSHSGGTPEEPEASDLPPPAQGWYVSDRGTVVLATQVPTATPHDSGLTSANCHAH
jgi:large exoprotein involved in heme utilization and adhesion